MNFSYNIKYFLIIVILLIISTKSFAQWVNDPTSNTVIVSQVFDPINISVVRDFDGGAFVIWQDKKENKSNVYFTHFDENGSPSFRSDGKTATENFSESQNPIAESDNKGNAIILFSETDVQKDKNLVIQKVTKNGLRLWGDKGIKLTQGKSEKTNYSLKVDKSGYAFVSYTDKSYQLDDKSFVKLIIIDPNGKIINDYNNQSVHYTSNIASETEIIPDDKGGAFVFWLESIRQKTQLLAQFIDPTGEKRWGDKAQIISKPNSSVINYSVGKFGNKIYAALTYQGKNKLVYQQLISDSGKLLWGNEGKIIANSKGAQSNPQFIFIDSTVVISWTSDFQKVKDVYLQRFDKNGNPIWGNNGIKVINNVQNQFGQKLIFDEKNGVIIAWIDKRKNKSFADLSIQKINLDGKFVWNPDGVVISSSKNLQKSYLNLIPDDDGGAIAVFKGSESGKSSIYGQKVFSTGTYASQILGFSSNLIGDSVKVFWYAANETKGTMYKIQRGQNDQDSSINWKTIGTLDINSKKATNYYEFYDLPDVNGSIFYRIVQIKDGKETQNSLIKQVDYYKDITTPILSQNSPNPFADSTSITFYLPQDELVTIEIFNSYVEVIEKIENKEYPAGKNTYTFYANGLEPGIYYYRLKTSDFVDVKKMIITN